ncbi:hypothetical protein FisN_14Hh046 [Fistulifera solaris]|jgi:hypothetical protein|uniref:Potassium channel tetramerisation-type BTB domain-containing protein n=1 Tax=Fistulifera solaris TaxID=1519565 RepID=A0A1Z5K8F5_FISSO|nr:hypothetical protein FisN_14Hh046 [Fistulifera solaris]|eukprot:GAX22432.1 hypothetical protein FisN_14Hh046 [Fistulifera solaris]
MGDTRIKKTRFSLDDNLNEGFENLTVEDAKEETNVYSFTFGKKTEENNVPPPTKTFHRDLVCLNVGGLRYEVSRTTMTQYEGSVLDSLAKTWNEEKFNSEIFVFRDGSLFAYVLDYLRSGKVYLPYSIARAALQEEFDHFQIPADMEKVYVEKDYFTIDRLTKEIKEHKDAIEEKERTVAAIIESYRLAHNLTASVMKHGFDWSKVVTPSFTVTPGIDKKLLRDCLLAQGVEVYGYRMENFEARISLGPIQDETGGTPCNGAYRKTATGSPFRFFDP